MQKCKSKQEKKVIQSSRVLRKKEWPSEKEQQYKQVCERYYLDYQKVSQKDYKEITCCKLYIQARNKIELNVLEAKTPSILKTQLNSKEESKDKYKKLEDILEEEITNAQPRSKQVQDLDRIEKEDNKDKDNLLEKRTYQIIMKIENKLLRIKESYRRIQL